MTQDQREGYWWRMVRYSYRIWRIRNRLDLLPNPEFPTGKQIDRRLKLKADLHHYEYLLGRLWRIFPECKQDKVSTEFMVDSLIKQHRQQLSDSPLF